MKKQYLRQGTVAVNWLQIYGLDFNKILATDATDELSKISTQLLYGDFRSISDPQYHAYGYAALQALQYYGQYLATIYNEQTEQLVEAQQMYTKAEAAPKALKRRLEEYQKENKHLKETIKNITEMNAALLKKTSDLKEKFNSIVPILQMLPNCRCGKVFINKTTLIQHMRTAHPSWTIPAGYDENTPESVEHSRPRKRAHRKHRNADRNLRSNNNNSDSDTSAYSSDASYPNSPTSYPAQRKYHRQIRYVDPGRSPPDRSRSNNVTQDPASRSKGACPPEPPRSHSSYMPAPAHTYAPILPPELNQTQGITPLPVLQAIPVVQESGQVQYILPRQVVADPNTVCAGPMRTVSDANIEKMVEKMVTSHMNNRTNTPRPVGMADSVQQTSRPGSYFLQNSFGKQIITKYKPDDYKIEPTSKSDLKSPVGFRQTSVPAVSLPATASPTKTRPVDSVQLPIDHVPNYVSSQLGSDLIPSLYEDSCTTATATATAQQKQDPYIAPANPTILQAQAPVITERPGAVFTHPPENFLSPFNNKTSVPAEQKDAGPREVVPAQDADAIAKPIANETMAQNWPELFQKPGAFPQNTELTEQEILRRISVINRSINNAVTAQGINQSNLSGYHSSLSTYEEYGSTFN